MSWPKARLLRFSSEIEEIERPDGYRSRISVVREGRFVPPCTDDRSSCTTAGRCWPGAPRRRWPWACRSPSCAQEAACLGRKRPRRRTAAGSGPGRGRARRVPDAREPVVRPLLRHPRRRQRVRHDARPRSHRRGRAAPARRCCRSTSTPRQQRRVHLRPVALVAGRARVVERRRHGQLRLDPRVEPTSKGPSYGTLTMGYYDSADIPFYYDLAQNFTICDNYFCSVLGPTHPNRLMQMTRHARSGRRPRRSRPRHQLEQRRLEFTCSWTTMPEVLQRRQRVVEGLQPARARTYRPAAPTPCSCARTCSCTSSSTQRPNEPRRSTATPSSTTGRTCPAASGATTLQRPNDFAHDVMKNTAPGGVVDHPSRRLRRAPARSARARRVVHARRSSPP